MFIILHVHVMRCSRRAYIQQIEILHYIDFVKKKDDLNTVVCYFTLALHPSDQHYITIINIFLEN